MMELVDEAMVQVNEFPDGGDMYFNLLGGTDYYPRTLVLDKDGVITFTYDGGLSYDALKTQIPDHFTGSGKQLFLGCGKSVCSAATSATPGRI